MSLYYQGVKQGRVLHAAGEVKSGWRWDGSRWVQVFRAEEGPALYENTGLFTTSRTVTPPEWAEFVRVVVWGAGGGGAGGDTALAQTGSGGSGGSARDAIVPAAAATFTIPAGGTGGAKGNPGKAGGNGTTSGAAVLSAPGGSGGSGTGSGIGMVGASVALLDGSTVQGGYPGGKDHEGSPPGGGGGGGSGGIFGAGSPGRNGGSGGGLMEFFTASWARQNGVALP